MTGTISLYHLINNSLMAELACFQDRRLERLLFKNTIKDKGAVFKQLKKGFEESLIQLPPEIIEDWEESSYIANEQDSLLKCPKKLFPFEHQKQFFLQIMGHLLALQQEELQKIQQEERSQRFKTYELRKYLNGLEQLIIDNKKHQENTSTYQDLRISYHFSLVYQYLWVYGHFEESIGEASFLNNVQEWRAYFLLKEEDPTIESWKVYWRQEVTMLYPSHEKEDTGDITDRKVQDMAIDIRKEISFLSQQLHKYKNQLHKRSAEPDYIKPKQAAGMLGISTSTLANWRKKGKLKDIRQIANAYHYNTEEIRRFINRKDSK